MLLIITSGLQVLGGTFGFLSNKHLDIFIELLLYARNFTHSFIILLFNPQRCCYSHFIDVEMRAQGATHVK